MGAKISLPLITKAGMSLFIQRIKRAFWSFIVLFFFYKILVTLITLNVKFSFAPYIEPGVANFVRTKS
jgi:hypothetical protein